jgi:protein-S-isoprenylcysteine O-methyltransferase Ste14
MSEIGTIFLLIMAGLLVYHWQNAAWRKQVTVAVTQSSANELRKSTTP